MNCRKALSVPILMLALASLSCMTGGSERREPVYYEDDFIEVDEGDSVPLPFTLSEGQPGWDAAEARPPRAQTTDLTPAQLQNLLDRLPPIQADESDIEQARLPLESLPPPRPGEEIALPFPPPHDAPQPALDSDAPLAVLRYSPQGDVPLAPQMSVTFNQPMVALTSHRELGQEDPPAFITPAVPGHWRWVGTRTLFFEAALDGADRMPMATEYTVQIPAGTKSAAGSALEETVTWTFRTPPPTLQTGHPTGGPLPLDPVLFAQFDQRIDPAKLIDIAQVTARGQSYAVRLANEEEIASDNRIKRLIAAAPPDRWLAFVAEEPLPADTTVTVTFPAGTPSEEGPLVSAHPQSFSFQTLPPFALRRTGCGYDSDCPPGAAWFLQFNNPIDAEEFDPALFTIEPEPQAVSYDLYGNRIEIRAVVPGRATYRVTVPADLSDVFGQSLTEDLSVQFSVGPAQAILTTNSGGPIATLDPYASPAFLIYTVNLKTVSVRAFRVSPEDYSAYSQWQEDYRRGEPKNPPGQTVLERKLQIIAAADQLVETSIDLSDALEGETGHLILVVEPEEVTAAAAPDPFSRRLDQMRISRWVQVTHLGVEAFVDADEMLVWANRLSDGAPVEGASVQLWPTDTQEATDANGTARLPLPSIGSQLLIARHNNDVAFLPRYDYFLHWDEDESRGWFRTTPRPEVRYYVFDDRKIYRPGETVSVKGWVRRIEPGPEGDLNLFPQGAARRLSFVVNDSSRNQISTGATAVNALGGFHFEFEIPENVNLGYAWIELQPASGTLRSEYAGHYHEFQVQEFRRPEFEVSARLSEGPHVAGGHALATVSAAYFAGGPLPNADVEWGVEASTGYYEPPNWSGFVFGKWSPWWRYDQDFSYIGYASFTSRTDVAGEHNLLIEFPIGEAAGATNNLPVYLDATATVFDVNRQAWSSRANLLLHPADRYVGLRTDRYFVEQGDPLPVELVVTDIDGNPIEGHSVTVRAARLAWEFRDGSWREKEEDVQECTAESSAASDPHSNDHDFASCTFDTALGGEYRISATVVDAAGRSNLTEMTRWVSGGQRPPSRNVEQENLQLIPDGETYAPGDTALILVQAPFFPAEGLLTLRRDGIVTSERFTMDGPTHTLTVPIGDALIPNVYLQVDLVGSAVRVDDAGNHLPALPRRPAYASGQLNLSVPPLSRRLHVDAAPRSLKLEPGGETTIDVSVHDADGEPVADAEFAIVVVDEAILALTGYQLLDPVSHFYRDRGPGVSNFHNRANLQLASPQLLQAAGPSPTGTPQPPPEPEMQQRSMAFAMAAPAAAADMAMEEEMAEDGGESADGTAQIRLRLDFDPLALFAPEVRTDANGRASVSVTLPDNLTRYRVMVVSVSGGKYFGTGESNLTARLPLMVRPSPPRFLNFGDSFELPVVLQNQTDEPLLTHVVVRAANAGLLAENNENEAAGYALTVPANDRVEVRFPTTTASPGTARFQFAAADANQPSSADAAEIDLPVYTPATTEAFAVYGEIDASGAILQTLRPTADTVPNYGGLEVTLSSTALQALTDAFLYLVQYPYECTEQIASRILGVAALRDVLTAFDAEGLPSPAEIVTTMERDLQMLQALQHHNGGFPIWRRGGDIWPYHSIHVAHALARARIKGYQVPGEMLSRSLDYLRNVEDHIPHWYGADVRRGLSSYALYVRTLLGDHDPAKAKRLIDTIGLENLSLESIGWLLFVLSGESALRETVDEIGRFLNNRVTETAGAATVASDYSDGDYLLLHSDRRSDAVLLEALVIDQPDSDLITKLVRGLLGHRTAGRWSNTQENVWVLLAMDRYFNTFESLTPDFVARIWLGEQFAGGHAFVGRSTEIVNLDLPMHLLPTGAAGSDDDLPLVLQKEGQGRLYYRLGLRYAPQDLRLAPADHGFAVERVYEAVDDPADVRRDEDGAWHIRAGARVRIKLTMAAPSRRVHVALADPLPAGLEILNPDLAVTANPPEEPDRNRGRRWWGSWYQHQNLRDQRAEAFTSLLWAGVYKYSYMARATTPGTFIAPPAKAEEMYAPETFGRSGTDMVVIEENEE